MPGSVKRAGRGASDRGALVGWVVSLPFSFAAATFLSQAFGSAAGMTVALRWHIPWSLAVLGVALAGLAFGASAVQLFGALAGWALGRLVSGPVETSGEDAPSRGRLRARDRIALALLLLPQGFPLSLLLVPALPGIWSAVGRIEERSRAVAWLVRGAYLTAFSAGMFALYRWAPFFTVDHVLLLALLPVAAGVLAARRPGKRSLLLIAAALALSRAFWPPLDIALSHRLAAACVLAVVAGLPAALFSPETAPRVGAVPVFCTTLALGLYAHWAILFALPSPGSVARIESQPGVRVEVRLPGTAAFSENRFYIDGCSPEERFFGSRETWHGLTRPFPVLSLVPSLPIDSGNNMILLCDRGEGWLGDYARGVIHRIDLATFTILPEPLARGSRGPTLLQLGASGGWVYAMDDSGAVQAFDVATGEPGFVVSPCVVNGFFADEPRGRFYAASCGFLYAYDMPSEEPVARLDLRAGFTLPFPFETHFHRVAADPDRDRLYVTYAQIGAVFRISGRAMRIERVLGLENGGRDTLYDSLSNLLFVGNYATGDLVVIDPERMQVLARLFVGKRIRNIARSRHGPRLTLTSAAGGISVDLPVALEGRGWTR